MREYDELKYFEEYKKSLGFEYSYTPAPSVCPASPKCCYVQSAFLNHVRLLPDKGGYTCPHHIRKICPSLLPVLPLPKNASG